MFLLGLVSKSSSKMAKERESWTALSPNEPLLYIPQPLLPPPEPPTSTSSKNLQRTFPEIYGIPTAFTVLALRHERGSSKLNRSTHSPSHLSYAGNNSPFPLHVQCYAPKQLCKPPSSCARCCHRPQCVKRTPARYHPRKSIPFGPELWTHPRNIPELSCFDVNGRNPTRDGHPHKI